MLHQALAGAEWEEEQEELVAKMQQRLAVRAHLKMTNGQGEPSAAAAAEE